MEVAWANEEKVQMARAITATEFRAKCLGLFDKVGETREPLVITKRGKPVAQLVPVPLNERSVDSEPAEEASKG